MTIDGKRRDVTNVDPAKFARAARSRRHGGFARRPVGRTRSRSRRRKPTIGTGSSATPSPARLRARQRDRRVHDRRDLRLATSSLGNYLIPEAAWDRARRATVRHRRDDQAQPECVDRRGQGRGAEGRRPVLRPRRADAPGVHRLRRRADRRRSSSIVYVLLGARDHHRPVGHRQHAVAVGVRTDTRARPAARGRADAEPDAFDGALGVGDHRGVRHASAACSSGCSSGGASSRSPRDAQDFPAPYTVPFGQIIAVLIVGAIVGVARRLAPGPARRQARHPRRHRPRLERGRRGECRLDACSGPDRGSDVHE